MFEHRALRKRCRNIEGTTPDGRERKKIKLDKEHYSVNEKKTKLPRRRSSLRAIEAIKKQISENTDSTSEITLEEQNYDSNSRTQRQKTSLTEKRNKEDSPSLDKTDNNENKHLAKLEKIASTTTDSDSNSNNSDEEKGYEEKRQQNLKDNSNFLQQLGILKMREEINQSAKKLTSKNRDLKVKREKEYLPRRSSLRLRRINPDGIPLPELPPSPVTPEKVRKPAGKIKMRNHLYNPEEQLSSDEFLSKMKGLLDVKSSLASVTDTDKFVQSLKKMSIKDTQVRKVVLSRILSLAVHPSPDVVLAAAGDKGGRLGLWNVGTDDVTCTEPHIRPISFLEFNPFNPNLLFSCSFDGTMRALDLTTGDFDEVYSTPEDDDIGLTGFSWLSADSMVVAQSDGYVGVVDLRADGSKAEAAYHVHSKMVKSVHVHPVNKQYIVTGSRDSEVHVYDIRNMKLSRSRPIKVLPHSKSVDSAYFSPITGNQILTTAIDDRIRIYNSTNVSSDINLRVSIKHNNHTGRWLSNFRATWHPAREDVFVVGSMERPRQIELFHSDGLIVKTFSDMDYFNSICSLNVFHPSRNLVVGANSSGRVHVFM